MYNCLDSDRTVCRGLFIQHTESGMLMNNREKIVMKAFDLFMTNNGIGLSLNDILKELNMTKGGFYYYFKSRAYRRSDSKVHAGHTLETAELY